MNYWFRNPILQSFIDECAEKMREKVGEPDLDEDGRKSFINKEWGEGDEKEFLSWVYERLSSDIKLWRTFSPLPHRSKLINNVVNSFIFYTPRVRIWTTER